MCCRAELIGRNLRMLGADLVWRMPFIGETYRSSTPNPRRAEWTNVPKESSPVRVTTAERCP
jgi:hypothetical protein